MLYFGPQGDPEQHPLKQAQVADRPARMRVAVAFCSEAGARALGKLLPIQSPDGPETQWLVGIQNGLTQPEGLEYLANLPNSAVRVPDGLRTLETPGLRAELFFHPKVYVVESPTEVSIISSSGNLTEGGLLNNVEQFMCWKGSREAPEVKAFDRWWVRWWTRRSDAVTNEFLQAYDAVRPEAESPPGARASREVPIHEVEPAPADLRAANWMWIEVTRRLEGGSENQLELMLSAHHFFYPDDDPPRDIGRPLRFEDSAGRLFENPDRIIHFNGPPMMKKGNSMWRIRLPTENEGLSGYQRGNVAFRFERTAEPDLFRIEFAELGSERVEEWEEESRKTSSVPGPPPRHMGWA